MIGKTVREFLPKADLLPYLEAILRVYNLLGRRDNKFKARIKILVARARARESSPRGSRRSSRRTGARCAPVEPRARRASASAFAPPAFEAAGRRRVDALVGAGLRSLGRQQRHRRTSCRATRIVTISLKPIGGTPGDATAEQMELVADLAERYAHDELRVTHEQNLVLPHVQLRRPAGGLRPAAGGGARDANIDLVIDIIACPGLDYCALANARSIPVAQEHRRALRRPRPAARRSAS